MPGDLLSPANASLVVALIVFLLGIRSLAIARRERQDTKVRISEYLDETHKFWALFDSGSREEAKAVLARLSEKMRAWTAANL